MTAVAYEVSKKVFEGSAGFYEGKDEIVRRTGMNKGSAGDYITDFIAIRNLFTGCLAIASVSHIYILFYHLAYLQNYLPYALVT